MIIRFFESEGMDIFLAAPTGRAAKRMTEATGFEAKTIHRLLELNSALSEDDTRKANFERNQENPLEADVVIIDEMSMVDIQLFQALLKAILPGTRLILVGDVDQLPSVGPGQVLRDLMNSRAFPMVTLEKIFRQAGQSDIVVNAHRINRGEQITLDNKSKDFFLLERNDVNVIYKHMIQLIQDMLPRYVGATSFDIQVLTPMRKGSLGCETLNEILQRYLNPADPHKRSMPMAIPFSGKAIRSCRSKTITRSNGRSSGDTIFPSTREWAYSTEIWEGLRKSMIPCPHCWWNSMTEDGSTILSRHWRNWNSLMPLRSISPREANILR